MLKGLAVTGTMTKIITVGIGRDISMNQLRHLSTEGSGNSVLFPNVNNMTVFEQQLVNTILGKINLVLNYEVFCY